MGAGYKIMITWSVVVSIIAGLLTWWGIADTYNTFEGRKASHSHTSRVLYTLVHRGGDKARRVVAELSRSYPDSGIRSKAGGYLKDFKR